MTDIAISVRNLSKKYRLYDSPQHRLKEALHPFRKRYHRDFWALRDVSFEVKRGETFGIMGVNGSGKSTLLQVVCGVLQPSEGEVQVNGRISALLELGSGFNPEFTGRQNVYMNGALMGFTKEEMDDRFEAIAGFADIGDFVDQPVKTYSSGMYVRLAFAAAINVNPDILVVDEALSVGDMFFQAKCMTRMRKMIDSGVTLLFVSHDALSVKSLCENAILLQRGIMIACDRAEKVTEQYFATKVAQDQMVIEIKEREEKTSLLRARIAKGTDKKETAFIDNMAFQKAALFERIQNGKARFVNVQLLDENESAMSCVAYGQTVMLRMAVEVKEDLHLLGCGYHIKDKNGVSIVNSNSSIEDRMLHSANKGDRYIIDWRFKMSLMEGQYNIACVLSVPLNIEVGEVDFCDYVPCALQFQMEKRKVSQLYGYVHWDNSVEITNI
jgi:homopolymeric O-antigen transport system ATP-binding protein